MARVDVVLKSIKSNGPLICSEKGDLSVSASLCIDQDGSQTLCFTGRAAGKAHTYRATR